MPTSSRPTPRARSSAAKPPASLAARRRTAQETFAHMLNKPPRSGGTGKSKRKGKDDSPLARQDAEMLGVIQDFAFGDVWSRPGLPLQVRSLVTLGLLTGLYRTDQLRIHVDIALNLGVKPEQILEVILHASAYAGLPTGANARAVAREVFKKRGLLKERP